MEKQNFDCLSWCPNCKAVTPHKMLGILSDDYGRHWWLCLGCNKKHYTIWLFGKPSWWL
ncbi:MAG: hypothetical protein ACTSSA_15740 [Candidatus Freyarchaeota archaeon]